MKFESFIPLVKEVQTNACNFCSLCPKLWHTFAWKPLEYIYTVMKIIIYYSWIFPKIKNFSRQKKITLGNFNLFSLLLKV